MNRLFGTKKKEEVQIAAPQPEKKQIDLVEQSKKVDNRVNEIDAKVNALDNEIKDLYMKVRNSRGSQQQFHKQKLLNLMKKRKMYGNQQKNYMQHQMALDNVAFTQENIQNTMEMAEAMKQGYEANQALMKQVNLDELQDLRDNMQDMMWECNEINEAINYDLDNDIDEAEIDEELAEFENDLKIQGMLGPQTQGQQSTNQNKLGGLTN